MSVELGTAAAQPGEFDRGYVEVTDLPTGTAERLPVVIANGPGDGPTLWVTGSIHGDEVTGLAVAQDVMTEELADQIDGAVVCLPNLNPAGLRRNTRTSYYHDHDPNRYFPSEDDSFEHRRRVQELIDRRLHELYTGEGDAPRADALLSLHTASVGSIPHVIRDRVRYGTHRTEEEAESLSAEMGRLSRAFGLPVVNSYTAEEQEHQNLHRSIAGAALNIGGIPALTPELGSHSVVEEGAREAGVDGVRNVLCRLEMLPESRGIDPGSVAPVDFPVRRERGPTAPVAGLVRYHVDAGQTFRSGDAIADIVTPHGERLVTVEAERDGYMVGRREGIAVYENDPIASLAVRDDSDLVVERV